ncbi:MAG: hypothetical protein WD871_04485 [Xanthobacteraceae bacterium]
MRSKRLATPPNPRRIFEQAEIFFSASKHLDAHAFEKAPQYRIPAAVCGAFALELYFKCLLALERTDHSNKHELKTLFDRLSNSTKEELRARFLILPSMNTAIFSFMGKKVGTLDAFDVALEKSNNVFSYWRYDYEYEWAPAGASQWSDDLIHTTRSLAIELLDGRAAK